MIFKWQKYAFAPAFAAAAALPAHALDSSLHLKAGYDTGGDTFIGVTFIGGDTDKIRANEGFFFGAGVSLVNEAKNIETELSLSYKFDEIVASNGEIAFDRMPLEAIVFYSLPSVRIGGGVTYHLNPKLEGSGVLAGRADFKDAFGFLLQADWRLAEKVNLGVRYTILDYEIESTGAKFDSNGLGVVFSVRL